MDRLIETGRLLQCRQWCIAPSSWKTRLSIYLMWVPNIMFWLQRQNSSNLFSLRCSWGLPQAKVKEFKHLRGSHVKNSQLWWFECLVRMPPRHPWKRCSTHVQLGWDPGHHKGKPGNVCKARVFSQKRYLGADGASLNLMLPWQNYSNCSLWSFTLS